jgi:hypothetical protein
MTNYSVNPNGLLWVHDRWFDATEYEEAMQYDTEISLRRAAEEPRLWDISHGLLPFEEARDYVHSLGFLNSVEWDEYLNVPMFQ